MRTWIAICAMALLAVCVPEPATLGLMLAWLAVLVVTSTG